ncbi:uncharacterized protein TNCV_185001 [Trichonephila clavipes]|nr:uncharacterized protein TNCV_185001 [Trichonephila clavipes]
MHFICPESCVRGSLMVKVRIRGSRIMSSSQVPLKIRRVVNLMLACLIDWILTLHCSATRGLLATDHVILNHGQVTWTTTKLSPPLLTNTPAHQREDVSALDRFSLHRCPTRRVFSGTGLELMTCLP